MPDILPGYAFSVSSHRYRDLTTGRFVSRADIMGMMEAQVSALEDRLGAMAQAVAEGNLAPAYFAEQARTELRRAHLQQAALAVGGWSLLNQRDFGSVGRRLRDDYPRIINMAQGLADGTITLPQAMTRITGWAGNARLEFIDAERRHRQASEGMVLIERRTLGTSEHCVGCLDFYEMGWQPAGVLPSPGESTPCSTNCRCSLHSREVAADAVGEWIGTKRS